MADNTETVQPEETTEPAEQMQQEKTFTQAEVDAIVKARLERANKKASNDGNGADIKKELEDTRAELERLRQDVERKEMIAKVASEYGIPSDLLHGTSEEDVRKSADALKSWRDSKPANFPATAEGSSKPPSISKDSIMAIKDPVERREAIAAHLDLFKR